MKDVNMNSKVLLIQMSRFPIQFMELVDRISEENYKTIVLIALKMEKSKRACWKMRIAEIYSCRGFNTPLLCGVRRFCKCSLALADDTPSACGGVHSFMMGFFMREMIESILYSEDNPP